MGSLKSPIHIFCWGLFAQYSFAVVPPDELCKRNWPEIFPSSNFNTVAQNVMVFNDQVCIGSCWLYETRSQGPFGKGWTLGQCYDKPKPTDKRNCLRGVAGNPIRLSDGVKVERTIDIEAYEANGLDFGKTYSSQKGEWVFDLPLPEESVYFKNHDIVPPTNKWRWWHTSLPDGSVVDVTKSGPSDTISVTSSDRDFFVQEIDGANLVIANRESERYFIDTESGLLKYYITKAGKKFTYSYVANQLASLSDNNGKTLYFHRAGSQLECVQSSWGQAVHYVYDAQNRLIKSGRGAECNIRPIGFSYRTYHYENTAFPKALTGITDEKNIRYATWRYDEAGRAIESYHAGGAEYTRIEYMTSGQSKVTNALGKIANYQFIELNGLGKFVSTISGEPTSSCAADTLSQSYYPNGSVKTITHKNGSVTLYERDGFGRIILSKDGLKWPSNSSRLLVTDLQNPADLSELKVTQTCWHPTLNQPSRIIESTKITQFDYTATGQLKSQIVKPRPSGPVDCSISY